VLLVWEWIENPFLVFPAGLDSPFSVNSWQMGGYELGWNSVGWEEIIHLCVHFLLFIIWKNKSEFEHNHGSSRVLGVFLFCSFYPQSHTLVEDHEGLNMSEHSPWVLSTRPISKVAAQFQLPSFGQTPHHLAFIKARLYYRKLQLAFSYSFITGNHINEDMDLVPRIVRHLLQHGVQTGSRGGWGPPPIYSFNLGGNPKQNKIQSAKPLHWS
jgi:hypothetical protein